MHLFKETSAHVFASPKLFSQPLKCLARGYITVSSYLSAHPNVFDRASSAQGGHKPDDVLFWPNSIS